MESKSESLYGLVVNRNLQFVISAGGFNVPPPLLD